MKRITLVLCAVLFVLFSASLSFVAVAPYHIGIVTGTVSQEEDTYRGAEFMVKKYGDVNGGGMLLHVTMPDNFMQEMETTISQIAGFGRRSLDEGYSGCSRYSPNNRGI